MNLYSLPVFRKNKILLQHFYPSCLYRACHHELFSFVVTKGAKNTEILVSSTNMKVYNVNFPKIIIRESK